MSQERPVRPVEILQRYPVRPVEILQHYGEKRERFVVGLMSGTSVDGVDAALVRLSGSGRATQAELVAFVVYPYPAFLRSRVLNLSHGAGNAEEVSRVSVDIGHLFARAALRAIQKGGLTSADVDLIASHGQTISHTPALGLRAKLTDEITGATLQIGEAAVIAERLRVPVVSDFRAADVAAGGQGAPLVPYVDWCLLTHPEKTRAVQNIGGIGNVTYLPANAGREQVIGFDTGPGNMLIDRAVSHETQNRQNYDRDGHFAEQGNIRTELLAELLDDPFLLKSPPKSAGREQFGEAFFQKLLSGSYSSNPFVLRGPPYDGITTLTAFTAYSIADAYERFFPTMPDEVIVGGGGARNPALMQMLKERLAPAVVCTHDELGMDSDAKEALAFAVLANETFLGHPSNLPSVTGATRPVLLGKITLP